MNTNSALALLASVLLLAACGADRGTQSTADDATTADAANATANAEGSLGDGEVDPLDDTEEALDAAISDASVAADQATVDAAQAAERATDAVDGDVDADTAPMPDSDATDDNGG